METYLKVKVHADEKKEKLVQKSADTFEIWVKAPAERGQANAAVRSALAAHLGLPENKLSLSRAPLRPPKFSYCANKLHRNPQNLL